MKALINASVLAVALGATLAVLSGCAAYGPVSMPADPFGFRAQTGSIPVAGPDIYRQFADRTLSGGVNHRPGSWAAYNRADGFGIFHVANGSYLEIEWSIKGNRYCMSDIGDPEKVCFDVYHRAGGYQLIDEEGNPAFYTTSVQEGDPYRLIDFVDR